MSAYYDLFEKPDVRQTGEQQPLYARLVPKGTIERKEFINRVHLFTGISRSLLEGAMAGFMDELRDCLANGWTVVTKVAWPGDAVATVAEGVDLAAAGADGAGVTGGEA